MRMFRELAGWALLLLVQATPLIALVAFVAWIERDEGIPTPVGLAVYLLVLAWAPLLLAARRLREPDPRDVAEADGRRPVLLLHRFTRVAEPWWKRSLVFLPGFFRDAGDAILERQLVRRANAVGPVIPFARPEPSAAIVLDREWLRQLEKALADAALVIVVLDGSRENAFEIERARQVCGFHRLALVPPRRRDRAFAERYEAMRRELSYLPALHPRAGAIRFFIDGTPAPQWRIDFDKSELSPPPMPSQKSWFLVAIPLVAGVVSAIGTPSFCEAHNIHLDGDDTALGVFVVLTLGTMLAWLSRRAVRLVPANEAVMVFVAAFPWILVHVGLALNDADPAQHLRGETIGAIGSAPLLFATALVLALASLMRRAPGRSARFAVFGAAALLPFLPLAFSLMAEGVRAKPLVWAIVGAAIPMCLAAWAASGEGGRAHAPLPIGAGIAAALTVAAVSVAVSNVSWYEPTYFARDGSEGSTFEAMRNVDMAALVGFIRTWPWLAMIGPIVVVLVGTRFARRATPTAIGSLAAFVPFVFVCALSSGSQARACTLVDEALSAYDPMGPASSDLVPGFELPAGDGFNPGGNRTHMVVDFGGAMVGGRTLARPGELAYRDFEPGRTPALSQELARLHREAQDENGDPLRVAARRDLDFGTLRNALGAALEIRWLYVVLVTQGSDGRLGGVRFILRQAFPPDRIRLFLRVRATGVAITADDGTYIDIPHVGGALDRSTLVQRIRDRRMQDPNRYDIDLVVEPGVSVSDVIAVAVAAQDFSEMFLNLREPDPLVTAER